jgi:hypothetical protein
MIADSTWTLPGEAHGPARRLQDAIAAQDFRSEVSMANLVAARSGASSTAPFSARRWAIQPTRADERRAHARWRASPTAPTRCTSGIAQRTIDAFTKHGSTRTATGELPL